MLKVKLAASCGTSRNSQSVLHTTHLLDTHWCLSTIHTLYTTDPGFT